MGQAADTKVLLSKRFEVLISRDKLNWICIFAKEEEMRQRFQQRAVGLLDTDLKAARASYFKNALQRGYRCESVYHGR